MIRRDNLDGCDTLQKLKFKCDDCTGPFRPSVTWVNQGRISMTFKVGDYQLCVEYAPGLPAGAVKRVASIVNPKTQQKFCYYRTGYTAQGRVTDPTAPNFGSLTGTSNNVSGVRLPFEKCSSDSDCKNTGDECKGNLRWGGDYCISHEV